MNESDEDNSPLDWGKEINRGYLCRGEFGTFFSAQRVAALIVGTVLVIGFILGLITG